MKFAPPGYPNFTPPPMESMARAGPNSPQWWSDTGPSWNPATGLDIHGNYGGPIGTSGPMDAWGNPRGDAQNIANGWGFMNPAGQPAPQFSGGQNNAATTQQARPAPQFSGGQNNAATGSSTALSQQQPPTLPPQIGQQKFGDSGIGSLGGGGQTNVSLNLQGSATMNPQGANQNRGYPGWDFGAAGASGAGASGQMRLAEGGAVPAQQSRGIAALGRGKDTMLVHMTPGEVRGLQQLALAHGGSLTINPHTGLVEAGFLSSMLPMLIGAGLMMIPGMQPLGAAAITGAGYGVATGSLKKGLMAGLGAYGGAGLGGSLGGMGAEALATTPEAYATALGVEGAATGAGSQAAMLAEGAKDFGLEGLQRTAEAAMPNSPVQLQFPKYADMDMAQRAQAMQRGLGSVNPFSDTFNKTAATDFLSKNKTSLASAFAGPAMEAMKPQSMTPMKPEPDQYDRELARYHLAPNYQPYVAPRPNPYYSAVYAAEGGDVSRMASGGKTLSRKPNIPDVGIIPLDTIDTANEPTNKAARIRMEAVARRANLTPYTPEKIAIKGLGDIGPPTSMLANGGIAELPSEYAAGGKLLQGPGDGMSDSIPAVIKGPRPQRAALAQGEFVVPADVVSHLGNGSTDAGAKRLYAMMNNIRKARTGTKKQGKQINAAHFMPA